MGRGGLKGSFRRSQQHLTGVRKLEVTGAAHAATGRGSSTLPGCRAEAVAWHLLSLLPWKSLSGKSPLGRSCKQLPFLKEESTYKTVKNKVKEWCRVQSISSSFVRGQNCGALDPSRRFSMEWGQRQEVHILVTFVVNLPGRAGHSDTLGNEHRPYLKF